MDPIANLLTSLHNAEMAGHAELTVPASKSNLAILHILQKNGYVAGVKEEPAKPQGRLVISLNPGQVHTFKRISKPGRRSYVPADEIPVVSGGLGLTVISTSQGMMSGRDAKRQGIGGEVICTVF
jgi:small subunit ribosomal protein S8